METHTPTFADNFKVKFHDESRIELTLPESYDDSGSHTQQVDIPSDCIQIEGSEDLACENDPVAWVIVTSLLGVAIISNFISRKKNRQ